MSLSMYTYNRGQISLAHWCVIHYFLLFVISGCPHKTVQPCWKYLAIFSPQRIQCWNSSKILDTRVQRSLWGARRCWRYEIWGRPQKRLCPKTFVRDCSYVNSLWAFIVCIMFCVCVYFKLSLLLNSCIKIKTSLGQHITSNMEPLLIVSQLVVSSVNRSW